MASAKSGRILLFKTAVLESAKMAASIKKEETDLSDDDADLNAVVAATEVDNNYKKSCP